MKPKLCDCIGEYCKHRKDIKCCFCNIECDWEEDKKLWYCDVCNVYWTTDYDLVNIQPERSKREDINSKITLVNNPFIKDSRECYTRDNDAVL